MMLQTNPMRPWVYIELKDLEDDGMAYTVSVTYNRGLMTEDEALAVIKEVAGVNSDVEITKRG